VLRNALCIIFVQAKRQHLYNNLNAFWLRTRKLSRFGLPDGTMTSDQSDETTNEVVAFGPFRLFVGRRLLLEGEAPVRLGSRARNILVALVEKPGQVLSKQELLARVWPDTFVEEASLRVHVAALRRALSKRADANGCFRTHS
jgi:DNA-binding response OmpR family regulator